MPYVLNSLSVYSPGTAVVWGPLNEEDITRLAKERTKALALNTSMGWDGTGLQSVSKLDFLEALDVLPGETTQVGCLNSMPALKKLFLGSNCAGRVSLSSFPSLTNVAFYDVGRKLKLKDARDAIKLSNVSGNASQELIDELSQAPRLSQLCLTSPQFVNLNWLNGFRLVSLVIQRGTKLVDLSGIETQDSLKFLMLQDCRAIKKIDKIGSCSELRFLMLDECGSIESLSALKSLDNLELLSFIGDSIIEDGKISVLDACKKLRHLRFVDRKAYDKKAEAYSFDQQYFETVCRSMKV